jgi:cyanophycinase
MKIEKKSGNLIKGKLFIIGGGKRPQKMIDTLVKLTYLDKKGYGIILPMASEMIDTAIFYSKKQFAELGINNIFAINFENKNDMNKSKLDSIENASLIYITGGDQNKFMRIVKNTDLHRSIGKAYQNGAVIAGTSAGAAVMSKKMITGNELKYKDYTGDYKTIESNNIEISEGLGLCENIIIDQHFVKRMRMNRLITTCLENPIEVCIGIDESTAILIEGDKISVIGDSQIIVLKHITKETKIKNGLLGAENLKLSVYLPTDTFLLNN